MINIMHCRLLKISSVIYVLGHVQLFVNLWTVFYQAPSMGFQARNTGVGYHFLFQGIFLTQQKKLHLLHQQVDSLPLPLPVG